MANVSRAPLPNRARWYSHSAAFVLYGWPVAHTNFHRVSPFFLRTSGLPARAALLAACLSGVLLLGGCAALDNEMASARTAYAQARYEQANVWLDDLEDDQGDMDPAMRADFLYLRGMTAFRLGRRTEAFHALAVAREVDQQGRGLLDESERQTMDNALAELTPNTATFRAREEGEAAASSTDHAEAAPDSSDEAPASANP